MMTIIKEYRIEAHSFADDGDVRKMNDSFELSLSRGWQPYGEPGILQAHGFAGVVVVQAFIKWGEKEDE